MSDFKIGMILEEMRPSRSSWWRAVSLAFEGSAKEAGRAFLWDNPIETRTIA